MRNHLIYLFFSKGSSTPKDVNFLLLFCQAIHYAGTNFVAYKNPKVFGHHLSLIKLHVNYEDEAC